MAYHNTSWGRISDGLSATVQPGSLSGSASSDSAFTSAPRRRSESPPLASSPSPRSGSLADLPSTRVENYGAVMRAATDAGFTPPSRDAVQEHLNKALPPTPTSIVSAVEMTRQVSVRSENKRGRLRRRPSVAQLRVSPQTSRHVLYCDRSTSMSKPEGDVQDVSKGTRCSVASPGVIFESAAYLLEDEVSTAFSESHDGSPPQSRDEEPLSPRWLIRMRNRAHWYLKWVEQYRDD